MTVILDRASADARYRARRRYRYNLARNPNLGVGTTDWGGYVATGGNASRSRQTSGGRFGPNFLRQSWTASSTAVGGGITCTVPLFPGEEHAVSVYVRPSIDQSLRVSTDYRDAANVSLGTQNSTATTVPAGQWRKLELVTFIAPPNTTSCIVTIPSLSAIWSLGDTLDASGLLVEQGDRVEEYFDGSFPGGIWTGTANASISAIVR